MNTGLALGAMVCGEEHSVLETHTVFLSTNNLPV
jgi:hypothetical protein